jgi:hypothetical protein
MSPQQNFLLSAVLLALFIGIPTAVIWLRSKRNLSLRASYDRGILYCFKLVGSSFAAIAGLILLFAISDQIGLSHFGYPIWSLPILVFFIVVGYTVRRIASSIQAEKFSS